MSAGEYGGRVLRKFEGGGKTWISGATLSPEDVAEWPYANKMALHRVGKVEWFGKPDAEELSARGVKDVSKKPESSEPKEPVKAKEAQPKSKRTTKAKISPKAKK